MLVVSWMLLAVAAVVSSVTSYRLWKMNARLLKANAELLESRRQDRTTEQAVGRSVRPPEINSPYYNEVVRHVRQRELEYGAREFEQFDVLHVDPDRSDVPDGYKLVHDAFQHKDGGMWDCWARKFEHTRSEEGVHKVGFSIDFLLGGESLRFGLLVPTGHFGEDR